jgi:hypothetical protein
MRKLLIASTAIFIAGTAPSFAQEHSWCARTITNDSGDCSFDSFRQCMATVSGQAGDCISNPRMAYDQVPGPRGGRQHGWTNQNWSNGNRW